MKKSIYLIGTIILGAFSLALLDTLGFSIFGMANVARVFYPEPSLRPDINPDAVWDYYKGMYVLKEKELSDEDLSRFRNSPMRRARSKNGLRRTAIRMIPSTRRSC